MSIQYPYIVERLNVGLATQDENGNFQSNSSTWVAIGACRNENGRQQKFSKEDGSYLQATHLIQCPAGTLPLQAGTRIRVLESDGTLRVEGEVIYATKDRFHTRIWL
ncbi:hypothetical protein [Emticicia agri]|uniref:Head-tail adaptor protein n=1 Tax=Emticicia agri TaxID=2492393 RepID=A0A4Q5LWE2_9BACT|nr:hypothetical protein [Emticicia agri]RYU93813.1 hypothetical protein EWM59_20035 [Emticicia agri]